jgi:hypothetical protein
MSFLSIYTAANDDEFQGRCMAAAWITAQHVIAGDSGYDLSAPSRDFSYSLLRNQASIIPKQVAMQVLRNVTIAGNIAESTDSDIDWQTKEIWADLVSIG